MVSIRDCPFITLADEEGGGTSQNLVLANMGGGAQWTITRVQITKLID